MFGVVDSVLFIVTNVCPVQGKFKKKIEYKKERMGKDSKET
jgi:hypothetical protein